MANKIVSLLLQVKNAISPGVKEASDDLRDLNKRTTELESSLNKFDTALEAVESAQQEINDYNAQKAANNIS